MENSKPTKAQVRKTRKPVAARQRLEVVNKEADRRYRIIDATPDRVATFEDAGYRIEKINEHILGGQRTDVPTPMDNTIHVGGGKKQLLVSIEEEFYEEDQATKAATIDAREAGIKNPQTSEGQYGQVQVNRGDLVKRQT